MWGFLMGWFYPLSTTVFCTLIPRGQESEMMGLFTFVGQVIVWLPPLFFGVLNEAGWSMKWGLVLDAAFFAAALVVCKCSVRFEEAVEKKRENGEAGGKAGGAGYNMVELTGIAFDDDAFEIGSSGGDDDEEEEEEEEEDENGEDDSL